MSSTEVGRLFANTSPADQQRFSPAEVFASGERHHGISNTAYPIAHQKTFKPYRKTDGYHDLIRSSFLNQADLCLYTHIPFCEKRCYFCEYTVVGKEESNQTTVYMSALNQELQMYSDLLGSRKLVGFDIGGGTPSFVAAGLIADHIDQVNKLFDLDCEISIETTPKIASLEPDKINAYYQMGIRRISMGVQVTEPDLLKVLGRSDNGLDHHFKAVGHIRNAGFTKFNIDLMYGFAGQSIESWQTTLQHAIAMQPDYITLYRMRYKLTRISHHAERVDLDTVHRQSVMAYNLLSAAGYTANPGKNTFSRLRNDCGTSSYLTRRVIQATPYLGIGLGAQSFGHNTISYNSGAAGKNLQPYLRRLAKQELPVQDLYDLPVEHLMAKMIAVSFYFGEIHLDSFYARFGISLEDAFADAVCYVLEHGLMQYRESENGSELNLKNYRCLSLTEKGNHHFNGVISLFYAPSVQEYLIKS